MTDSDTSTTLPAVMHGRGSRLDVDESKCKADADPALALRRDWLHARQVARVLCRLQQRLERRILNASAEATDETMSYAVAYQAEVEAATAALKFQDQLPDTPARSLLGIVAKLEIIVGSDRDIDDPTDFPWPHIASVLDDLKKIAGSVPLEQRDRSAVQADCRRYQAMAVDLIGTEGRAGNLTYDQQPAIGVGS